MFKCQESDLCEKATNRTIVSKKTYTHKNASFIPSFIIYETKEQIGIFASFSTPPSWFVWRIIRLSNPTKSHLKPLGFPSFLQIVQSNFTHYHRSVSSVYSIPLDLDTPNNHPPSPKNLPTTGLTSVSAAPTVAPDVQLKQRPWQPLPFPFEDPSCVGRRCEENRRGNR